MFRAHDKKTGDIVSEFKLPANQSGIPMTYLAGGKQYIVVAVGAVGTPAEFVALDGRMNSETLSGWQTLVTLRDSPTRSNSPSL